MEIKLGSITIKLDRVSQVVRINKKVVRIYFITGNAIEVRCSTKNPSYGLIAYSGTADELKALIDDYINRRGQ